MKNIEYLDRFFCSQEEYIKFLTSMSFMAVVSKNETCWATLEKKGDYYLFLLFLDEDNSKSIGDYVKPFRASQENIDTFNRGVKILGERLNIYVETGDASQVPEFPPAFGDLTHVME